MPIIITCQGCQKRFKGNEALAGRTMACPACGGSIAIPAAARPIPSAESKANPAREPAAAPRRPAEPQSASAGGQANPKPTSGASTAMPARPQPSAKDSVAKKPVGVPRLADLRPPIWLRHMHWLLVFALIPLAVSLLWSHDDESFIQRLVLTISEAPEESQQRAAAAIAELEDGAGSLEKVFTALPGHKLQGAFLARDTWTHWLFAVGAALLFFTFLVVLSLEGSAQPPHLLAVAAFTGVVGILFLLFVQVLAMWSQGFIIIPRNIVGIIFWIFKLIGMSYRAASDPESGFWVSLIGFTLGVGLCEEICKALPIIFKYRQPNEQSWLGAYLWGLSSGAAFGLAEGIMYSGDYYNGISGSGIYLVRFISCVALHALWTGSAAITIHQRQHLFQVQEMGWLDWLLGSLMVVAIPMVLHGLYDTLLKKEMNALALVVAVASFLFLAFQISRLRTVDDNSAHIAAMRNYLQRRAAAKES